MTKVQAAAKIIEELMRAGGLSGAIVLIDVKSTKKDGITVETGSRIVIDTEFDMRSIPVIHNLKLELDECSKLANEAFDLLQREIPELDKMLQYEELEKS